MFNRPKIDRAVVTQGFQVRMGSGWDGWAPGWTDGLRLWLAPPPRGCVGFFK